MIKRGLSYSGYDFHKLYVATATGASACFWLAVQTQAMLVLYNYYFFNQELACILYCLIKISFSFFSLSFPPKPFVCSDQEQAMFDAVFTQSSVINNRRLFMAPIHIIAQDYLRHHIPRCLQRPTDAHNHHIHTHNFTRAYIPHPSPYTHKAQTRAVKSPMNVSVTASHHGDNRLAEFITGYIHPAHLYCTRCTRGARSQQIIHNHTRVGTRRPAYLNEHKQQSHHAQEHCNSVTRYCPKLTWTLPVSNSKIHLRKIKKRA